VLCARVTNMVALVDPITLRTVSLDAPGYWRTTFGALASQKQLVEYVVLDIEPLGTSNGKLQLAEAQVRRRLPAGGAPCAAVPLDQGRRRCRCCPGRAPRDQPPAGPTACWWRWRCCGAAARGNGRARHLPTHPPGPPAAPQVARSSDFGRNDTVFFCRTHLGHLLQPGDLALGYDLANANYVGLDYDEYVARGGRLPDVVLVRKSYEEKRRKKRVRPPGWDGLVLAGLGCCQWRWDRGWGSSRVAAAAAARDGAGVGAWSAACAASLPTTCTRCLRSPRATSAPGSLSTCPWTWPTSGGGTMRRRRWTASALCR
jgi:hypothetical protein